MELAGAVKYLIATLEIINGRTVEKTAKPNRARSGWKERDKSPSARAKGKQKDRHEIMQKNSIGHAGIKIAADKSEDGNGYGKAVGNNNAGLIPSQP